MFSFKEIEKLYEIENPTERENVASSNWIILSLSMIFRW